MPVSDCDVVALLRAMEVVPIYRVEFPNTVLGIVPESLEASKVDEDVKFPLAVPVNAAVIVPALKFPEASRNTIVDDTGPLPA